VKCLGKRKNERKPSPCDGGGRAVWGERKGKKRSRGQRWTQGFTQWRKKKKGTWRHCPERRISTKNRPPSLKVRKRETGLKTRLTGVTGKSVNKWNREVEGRLDGQVSRGNQRPALPGGGGKLRRWAE